MNQGGDVLARGLKSAIFGPPKVSQEAWDKIWAKEEPVKKSEDKEKK